MQVKLTLSLEKEVIEQAKEFSRKQHKSLSKMVENYLRLVTGKDRKDEALTPIVARLAGVLPPDAAENFKQDYTEYLEKKYR